MTTPMPFGKERKSSRFAFLTTSILLLVGLYTQVWQEPEQQQTDDNNAVKNMRTTTTTTTTKTTIQKTISQERLEVYDFVSTQHQEHPPPHLTRIHKDQIHVRPEDESLLPLDTIHREALLHRGVWMMLVDTDDRMLVLKRGAQLVTCPNAWTLVGEHQKDRESSQETMLRGIQEELGSFLLGHIQRIHPLVPDDDPLLYYREYGPTNDNRVDNQLTHVAWIQLDLPADSIELDIDEEVAEYGWKSVEEIRGWFREAHENLEATGETGDLVCHETVLSLWEYMVGRYIELKGQVESNTDDRRRIT